MPLPLVLHLIDDTTPGGVMRVIDFLTTSPAMSAFARHQVMRVSRGAALPACRADVIVSHLTVNWRALPRLIAFRARHAHLPLVHVEHSYTESFTAQNVPGKGRFFALLRTAYALFDRVVAVSDAQGDWLRSRGLVRASALRVISSTVDLSGFHALPAPRGRARVIGGIGRLHRQKGFDVLINAFRALPGAELELHLYGEGPEKAALQALAGDDPRIFFAGHTDDPETAMRAVDVVAMPSRWEAFGLVALETRAAGRRLICAQVDGLRDSGDGGLFVRGHRTEDWTAALLATLASAPPPRLAPGADSAAADWQAMIAELNCAEAAAA
ncbi:glycosyltransferase [Pacificoceanicola onchidii]|uniref:glycosyltransferase n=1 Tax=Pacificoceanicola onchidii TaxID=2562685 RepID=UPI0010A5C106|nr:glycosyltransferase [Pacificoceanicola onchidii]